MKILIVETAYPINSRTSRFVASLKENIGEFSVKSVCWNRDNRDVNNSDESDYIYFEKAQYGNRLAKLKGLKGFAKFVKQSIKDFKPTVIIASHWDALIIASLYKPQDTILVYENLDMPTGQFLVKGSIRFFEALALCKVDCITFASRFYLPYYKYFKRTKIVIENKLPNALCVDLPTRKNGEMLVVSFLGAIRYFPILSNLIKAVGDIDGIELHFYGGGPDYENIKALSKSYSNIRIYGPYQYSSIPEIYAESDIIWAAYPSDDFNVKLAISNKYHESLHFGIPAIYSKGTRLGAMVETLESGCSVDCHSINDIRNIIVDFRNNKEILSKKFRYSLSKLKENESKNWEEEITPFIEYIKTTANG